jgi:hypothetical protein
MRRILLFIIAAPLALAVWVTPAGAGGAHRDTKTAPKLRCLPSRVPVVAADREAALYLAAEDPELPEFLSVYGCSFKSGRSYQLGELPGAPSPSGGGGVRLETLEGTMAAYEAGSGGPAGASWLVLVRNLSTGKVVHRVPSGTPAHPEPVRTEHGLAVSYVGIGQLESLVVKGDGAVAWIVETSKENGTYQVHILDKTGGRVVAEGPEVEPRSLALAGSTLYWLQGGKPMSATLN